jgi:flavorubredoxin
MNKHIQEIKKDIFSVGVKDWNIRSFHGYRVNQGTSYNSYLIMDEKITLVDTVKEHFSDEFLEKVGSVVDFEKIEYLICNHVEMDHSGAMPAILKLAKNATVITNAQGKQSLADHYDISDWKIQVITSGEVLNIGKRNLTFVQTPMLHWPDSMVTYVAEDKLLLSNDAFGQHIAADDIFANKHPIDVIFEAAKNYYANILYPFVNQADKALGALKDVDIEMIAPAHGCIWQGKEEVNKILSLYQKWHNNENDGKAVVIYDTMWGSTEKLAKDIVQEFEEQGIETILKRVGEANHISDVIVELLDAKYVVIGSSTLNNQILPTVASFMTYMKGLSPRNKVGFTFGSYGWAPGAIKVIHEVFEYLKWETPVEPYMVKYVPVKADDIDVKVKIKELIEKS